MQESDQEPEIDEWHGVYVVSIQDYTIILFTMYTLKTCHIVV